MVAPAVVIELPAADQGAPAARAMLAACNASVKHGCSLADPSLETDDAAVAVVTWDDAEHRRARIEVGLRRRGTQPARWVTRTLALSASDALPERWRAVGLVIATLVDEEIRAEAPPPPPPNPSPPPSPSPNPPPPPSPSPNPPPNPRVWLDLGALGAPALDSGSFLAGGVIRGAWYPARAPVFVTLGFAYATTPVDASGLRVDSIAATLGAGLSYRARAFLLDGTIAARLERVGATIDDPSGASDAAATVLGGAQLGVDVGWAPSRAFAVVLGADAFVRSRGATVQVRGIAVGRALPVSGDLHVGVRLSL